MATPIIGTGLTRLTDCEAADAANWVSAGGGGGSAQNTDILKEGAASRGRRCDNKTDFGFGLDYFAKTAGTVDLSNTHIWVWFQCLQPGDLATIANGGVRIRVSENVGGTFTTNYVEWAVAGSDTYKGGWVRLCIDTSKTATGSNGTCDLSAIGIIGIIVTIGDVGGNVPNVLIDCVDYGDGIIIYGGSSGDELTWDDIADIDTGDPSKSNYGVIEKIGGVFFCLGKLQLGEAAGINDMYLKDANQILSWQERKLYETTEKTALGASFNRLILQGSAAAQDIDFEDGIAVGSGDTQSGRSGSIFMQEEGAGYGNFAVDMSDADIDYVYLYGSIIRRADQGVSFSADATKGPDHRLSGINIDNCGQVDIGRVVARNAVFSGYTLDADGALLWNENIDIKNSSFLGNTDGTNDPAAIEHPSAAGTPYAYDNLQFSGNDYDVNNTSGSSIEINKNNGSNPITYKGSLVTFLSAAVDTIITVKDVTDQSLIENARVLLEAADGAGPFNFEVSVSITRSGTTATVIHTAHGLATNDWVHIQGCVEEEYNIVVQITYIGVNSYSYQVAGSPSSPATGSPTSTDVIFNHLTNASGIVSDSRMLASDQNVIGRARRSTVSPLYKNQPIVETIDSADGLAINIFLIPDE